MSDCWDCIVVGAGVVGLWTAYHLVQNGKKTLIIDQFVLPHTRGSSHGQSMLFRMADANPGVASILPTAKELWLQLEKKCGKTLYKNTGLLRISSPGIQRGHDIKHMMKCSKFPFKELSGKDINKKYPHLSYPEDVEAVLDLDAGVLLSDRCISALKFSVVKHGGVIHDAEPVKKIHPGAEVTVVTAKSRYVAKKVVLTPGPWADDILKSIGLNLPLLTVPCKFMYWRDTTEGAYSVEKGMPIVIHATKEGEVQKIYLLYPSLEYENQVKIMAHVHPPIVLSHPDERDSKENHDAKDLVVEYIKSHLPGIDTKLNIEEPCMSTITPDGYYIIDYHPKHQNIIIGCGMSGHGFKTAPATGKLLMEMATDQPPSVDLRPFCMARFAETSK